MTKPRLLHSLFSGGTQAAVICLMTGSRLFLTEAALPFPVEVERKT
ncbi:MAG: hypothetical protein WAL00_14650 [Exiguobacterium undae]